jgi:hypothetical protein
VDYALQQVWARSTNKIQQKLLIARYWWRNMPLRPALFISTVSATQHVFEQARMT